MRGVMPGDPNAVRVEVEDLEFLGPFCRARLKPEVETAGPLVADFSANLMRDLDVAEGRRLLVALTPEALRVFAPPPAAPAGQA